MTRPGLGHPGRLDLIRHGESSGNVANDAAHAQKLEMLELATRDMDVPLSERGERQAAALGRWFADQHPDLIVASPYRRAVDTGRLALDQAGRHDTIRLDERLREREFGILDRLTRRGIEQLVPEQAALRRALGKFYHRPPGGESWCDVILRLRTVIDTIARDLRGERVLIVCHSVVVLCFRYLLGHMTEEQILAIDRATDVANCSLTTYELSGNRLELQRFNFVAPLKEEGAPVTTEPDAPVKPK